MIPALDTVVRFIIAVLFNGLWEAALLAIVAWIALRAMPNGNATTRHSVLVAALLASLVLPVVTAVATTMHPAAAHVATSAHSAQTAHVTASVAAPKVAPQTHETQATPEIVAPPRALI